MCESTPRTTEALRHRGQLINLLRASVSPWFVISATALLAAQAGPYERQKIDEAAAMRGRAVYAQHCINCHGSTAKGSDRGPDLIRSVVVLRDRLGSSIGPAVAKSATHQSTLTRDQIVDL